MGEVIIETLAYAKLILHAAKYPHCAINGLLLADATNLKEGAKNQDLTIVDAIPLFHHSHNLAPMPEIALTQVEAAAQAESRVIAGYYAACENFNNNTPAMCPSPKIADKIAEYFPSAIFVVIDNKRMVQHLDSPALKLHRYADGNWKLKETNKILASQDYALEVVSHLLYNCVHRDLVDFDNYLDDQTQDWTNSGLQKVIDSISATNEKEE